jgi:hypothetical protein
MEVPCSNPGRTQFKIHINPNFNKVGHLVQPGCPALYWKGQDSCGGWILHFTIFVNTKGSGEQSY